MFFIEIGVISFLSVYCTLLIVGSVPPLKAKKQVPFIPNQFQESYEALYKQFTELHLQKTKFDVFPAEEKTSIPSMRLFPNYSFEMIPIQVKYRGFFEDAGRLEMIKEKALTDMARFWVKDLENNTPEFIQFVKAPGEVRFQKFIKINNFLIDFILKLFYTIFN